MLKPKGERITGHEINCFKEQKQDDGTDQFPVKALEEAADVSVMGGGVGQGVALAMSE